MMRKSADEVFTRGQIMYCESKRQLLLVETLLDRGADGDAAEAKQRSPGWQPLHQPTGQLFVKSGCCGCARC